MTTAMLKLGTFARRKFASQTLANSHTAQTADWDELYGGEAPVVVLSEVGGKVWMCAWTEDQRARREVAEPTQMARRLKIRLWINLSRGRIATERTEMIAIK